MQPNDAIISLGVVLFAFACGFVSGWLSRDCWGPKESP
jgi:hypothetical protein